MKCTVEQTFYDINHTCRGAGYRFYENVLQNLMHEMRDKFGHPFTGEEYRYLRFDMNVPLYREFCIICQTSGHDSEWCRDIKILLDPNLYIGNTQSPVGIVRLIYEEPETKRYNTLGFSNELISYFDRGHGFQKVPHIDHVIFNSPATIVFWEDGTKTVVKHDGKGRKDKKQAILYAFIRKIYGEGKPYHNILNEIEEAVK